MKRSEVIFLIIAKYSVPLFIVLILFIAFIKSSFEEKIDPMDNSYLKSVAYITEVKVVDENHNGFHITYFTKDPVTKERAAEIRSREHINESLEKLRIEAPLHFGDMLYTDIHDFASFAIKYTPDKDIKIDVIFVYGRDKIKLYEAPNPNIKNCATYISPLTLQGNQYIKNSDINKRPKTYRYWKCSIMHATSSEDERFIHFSKDEEIK